MSNHSLGVGQKVSVTANSGKRLQGFALVSVLAALMLTLLLEALDQTVVGTALPKIIGYLHGFDHYTWVVTAYLLTSTSMIPIVGKLSDQFGRKWFSLVGVAIFLLGSMLSGMAQTMDQLIAFRALQGLGAGIGIALVFTIIGDIFPPAERGKWEGMFASVYAISSVIGPTIGGWLADHGPLLGSFITDDTRWRWVFYVNLPLGMIAFFLLLLHLPSNLSVRSSNHTGWAAVRRIDFLGAALAAGATICLLLGLTWGSDQTYTWSSLQVIGMLVAAGILYVCFFLAERFAVEPILPLDLFRMRTFSADAGLALTSGMVLLALVICIPLFLQGVLGISPTNSGLIGTPLTVSLVVGAAFAGAMISIMARYQKITIAGTLLMTIGVYLLSRMTASTSLGLDILFMVIAGLGLGMLFPVPTLVVQNTLRRNQLGVGTGAINYLAALGQTLGVAIAGIVINNTIASDIFTRLPASVVQQLTPAGVKLAANPQALVNPSYRDTLVRMTEQHATHQQALNLLNQVFDALKQSLTVSIQHSFLTVLVFCGGVLLAALLLKDVPLARKFHDEPASSEAETVKDGNEVAESALPV